MLRVPVRRGFVDHQPWVRFQSSSSFIRSSFIDYFQTKHGHKYVKSSSVVPLYDASVPFVNAGMNQFKGVFLGKIAAPCLRAVNSQKCVRVGGKHNDLDVVGTDGHHHTFFEMLGNWSFGDYYKKEACKMAWDLLLGPYRLKPDKLVVTYFMGDAAMGLKTDIECRDIWRAIGVADSRLLEKGSKDNFWEMGATGPCGPCTEIHYVNPDGSLTEIWNLVFIQCNRLGIVPCRESSVVIAVSSPHRRDSLDAVSHCIETLKASVPIWKKEVYEGDAPVWKENIECTVPDSKPIPTPAPLPAPPVDKTLVQINVSCEELQQRIQNFMERKREQVNISNIHDFIPNNEVESQETDTCARVRAQFVRRSDSKGHLKVRKVHNEWGPQTVAAADMFPEQPDTTGLPSSIAERVMAIEKFLNIGPVSKDVYKRLKVMEDKIAYLQAVSPEYAQFWKTTRDADIKQEAMVDYTFSAEDIAKKIEQLEKGIM